MDRPHLIHADVALQPWTQFTDEQKSHGRRPAIPRNENTCLDATRVFKKLRYVFGRTREIGIRVALGAGRAQVLWLVMREVLLLAAGGVALGLPAALALSRLAATFLFGVTPN